MERLPANTYAATATTRSWSDLEIQRSVIVTLLLVGIDVTAGLCLTTEVNGRLQPTVVSVDLQRLAGPASAPAYTTG